MDKIQNWEEKIKWENININIIIKIIMKILI